MASATSYLLLLFHDHWTGTHHNPRLVASKILGREIDTFLLANLVCLFVMAIFVCCNSIVVKANGPNSTHDAFWAFAACIMLVGANGSWLFRAYKLSKQMKTPKSNLIQGKNWYRYDFGNPFFMESPWPKEIDNQGDEFAETDISPGSGTAGGTKI